MISLNNANLVEAASSASQAGRVSLGSQPWRTNFSAGMDIELNIGVLIQGNTNNYAVAVPLRSMATLSSSEMRVLRRF